MQKPAPTRAELQRSLGQLHTQLTASPRLDQGTERLLREVLQDIEGLLNGPDSAAAAPAGAAAPRRLEQLAIQFDTRHPLLAASVRQFVELLGRAGL